MWRINASGDYELQTGSPVRIDAVSREMWFRLSTPIGEWIDDATLGSRLHELSAARSAEDAARQVRPFVLSALKPMTDAGRLISVDVTTEIVNAAELRYRVSATGATGQHVFEGGVAV